MDDDSPPNIRRLLSFLHNLSFFPGERGTKEGSKGDVKDGRGVGEGRVGERIMG